MNLRPLLLVLSTTALSVLAGCATSQAGSRGDTAASTSSQQGLLSDKGSGGCSCALKPQGGSAQASEDKGAGCGCPHCAKAAKGDTAEATACGCGHHDKEKGGSAQASDGVR
jgi:hypothetical protein